MAGSRFVSHIKWWFFFVPLLAIFLMPAIPDRALFEIPDAEVLSVAATIGDARADAATQRANVIFRHAFVDTGLVRRTVDETTDGEIDDGGISSFARGWVHNFWMLIYRLVYRATVMHLWLAGTFAFGVAAFIDGTARRKIKAAAAGFASPLSFHLAGHGILLTFGVAFTVLIAPVPLYAPTWVAVAAVLGALLWKASSSYQ